MQGLLRVLLADKVGTPLLEQLPRRMAAGVAVLVPVQLPPPLVEPAVVSGQREVLPVLRQHTALVAAVAAHQQA